MDSLLDIFIVRCLMPPRPLYLLIKEKIIQHPVMCAVTLEQLMKELKSTVLFVIRSFVTIINRQLLTYCIILQLIFYTIIINLFIFWVSMLVMATQASRRTTYMLQMFVQSSSFTLGLSTQTLTSEGVTDSLIIILGVFADHLFPSSYVINNKQ